MFWFGKIFHSTITNRTRHVLWDLKIENRSHPIIKCEANCSQDWFKPPHVILINECERMTKLILLIYLLRTFLPTLHSTQGFRVNLLEIKFWRELCVICVVGWSGVIINMFIWFRINIGIVIRTLNVLFSSYIILTWSICQSGILCAFRVVFL